MKTKIKIIVKADTIKGTAFVGVRNYTNAHGEVSNQTFLAGISYAKMLQNDLKKVESFRVRRQVVGLFGKYGKALVAKAYEELVTSLRKRTASEEERERLREASDHTIKRSDDQREAFLTIAKGVKVKRDNGDVYVFGLRQSKKVLQDGEYPEKKRRPKTIVKEVIQKNAELRGIKYRMFKIGNQETVAIQGDLI